MTRKNLFIFTGSAQSNLKQLGAKKTGFQADRASKNYTLSRRICARGAELGDSQAAMYFVTMELGRNRSQINSCHASRASLQERAMNQV
jgi:hypothetical protein